MQVHARNALAAGIVAACLFTTGCSSSQPTATKSPAASPTGIASVTPAPGAPTGAPVVVKTAGPPVDGKKDTPPPAPGVPTGQPAGPPPGDSTMPIATTSPGDPGTAAPPPPDGTGAPEPGGPGLTSPGAPGASPSPGATK